MEDVEYTTLTMNGKLIKLSKVGGGTVGQAYTGNWEYEIWSAYPHTLLLMSGTDLHTGTAHTHAETALILSDFEEESY